MKLKAVGQIQTAVCSFCAKNSSARRKHLKKKEKETN